MNSFVEHDVSLEKCPVLVLNADYRPLSYYPYHCGHGKIQLSQYFWIE